MSQPMVKGNKVQVTIQLDPDQVAAIDLIADKQRSKRSVVVRNAVDVFLAEDKPEKPMPPAPADRAEAVPV